MIRSWLTRLIIPTLHIHSGLANWKAWTTQLMMVQIKTTIKSFTKTCITSSQHASVNQPSNKCQGCIPLTSLQSSCHHKPFPEGRDTAKLWFRSGLPTDTKLIQAWTSKGTHLGQSRRTSPTAQTLPEKFLQIVRVSWILQLKNRRTRPIPADLTVESTWSTSHNDTLERSHSPHNVFT